MSNIIGRGRYARETYPKSDGLIGANALGNWVINPQTDGGGQTFSAIGVIPISSVALRMKFSGVVRVGGSAQFTGATGPVALELVYKLFTDPVTPLFARSGTGVIDATPVAFSRQVAQDSINPLSWGATLESDSAGLPANTYTFDGASVVTGSTGLMGIVVPSASVIQPEFSFDDLVTLGPGTARFPDDGHTWIVLTLALNTTAAGGTAAFPATHLSLQEQPL